MRIPSWILKTAEKDDIPVISFSDPAYEELLSQYKAGTLDDDSADAVEQIEYLRDVMNVAVSKLLKGDNSKEAATKELPKDMAAEDLPAPPKKEVPPPSPSGTILPARDNKNDKKREKTPEPEATKWKEIRYNKRDGKWEAIVTTRSVRHFNTEDEAIDFTKKI